MTNEEALLKLVGKTATKVIDTGDEIHFFLRDGSVLRMWHYQECCEGVYVEDIAGDLSDLVGTPILQAEESSSEDEDNEDATWTFYKFSTIKGSVTIRWYGESSGYYGTQVDCEFSKELEEKRTLEH